MAIWLLGLLGAPLLLLGLTIYDHNHDKEKENNPDERNKEKSGTKSDKSSPKD